MRSYDASPYSIHEFGSLGRFSDEVLKRLIGVTRDLFTIIIEILTPIEHRKKNEMKAVLVDI
jgi:hypothetical protein